MTGHLPGDLEERFRAAYQSAGTDRTRRPSSGPRRGSPPDRFRVRA